MENLIYQLSNLGYFKLEGKIASDIFTLAYLNQEKFFPDSQFALIYIDELQKITEFKKHTKDVNKMNSSIILLVLSYLRVNMLRRQGEYFANKSDKPEFCYRMYIDIEKDIGISNRYISRAVKILNEMDLIVSEEMPRYKDEKGNWHTEVTLFVNKYKREKGGESLNIDYDYQQELAWGKEYVKEKKYLNKKFYQDV
jgi:hypothetical protein